MFCRIASGCSGQEFLRFVVGLWTVALAQAIGVAQLAVDKPPAADKQETRTQKWEFGILMQAVGGPCTGFLGTFPVPMDWPEQQVKIVSEEMSPGVQHHSYRTADGIKQMIFSAPQINAGGSAECFVLVEVTRTSQKPPDNPGRLVIPKDAPGNVKKFLGVSPMIEATNPKVKALARELTGGKETAWEQVRAIQEGVREKVKFEVNGKERFKGVVAALRDGKADREDQAATFVAVCRAAKIPARMVWAMDFCYAEFYLEDPTADMKANAAAADDAQGRPAAGTKVNKRLSSAKGTWYPAVLVEGVELGVCNDAHPITQKGDNFQVPEEKGPQRSINFFARAKGQSGGKPTVEFRRRRTD